jgi:beta-N-acetylhexosaminidase
VLKTFGAISVFLIGFSFTGIQQGNNSIHHNTPYSLGSFPWADSVIKTMTIDEKIGQLFMVAAYSNKDEKHTLEIDSLITQQHVGGLIFFQGGPVREARLTNHFQSKAKIPLMISIDGEWGLAMRLDSTVKYPWQMTLGAIQDESLIYKMGRDIALQCRRLGIHVNLAPVADVNVNPKNPVINARSFGENKYNVANKSIAYMKGMQDNMVMANAKHFPGHGDTDKDSHKTLPIITHTHQRMNSIELYPFKKMIEEGLGSVMVAHLYIPAYVKEENTATTLSPEVVNGLLKDSLGFKGLSFTDALNMKGVSNYYKPGEADLKALLAGNDVLLFPKEVPKAVTMIKQAIVDGQITKEEIENRCLKILRAKEWLQIHKREIVEEKNIYADLNKPKYEYLNQLLFQKALTLLRNKNSIIPIQKLEKKKIMSISFTDDTITTPFQEKLLDYAKVNNYTYNQLTPEIQTEILKNIEEHDIVLVSIHKSDKSPWVNYNIPIDLKSFVNLIRIKKKTILTVFANPYSLIDFDATTQVDGMIMAYQNSIYSQEGVAQAIFGAIEMNGKLPVTVSSIYKEGYGLVSKKNGRLKYSFPEEEGLDSEIFKRIDSLVLNGIKEKAFPGCQVFVAKNGTVIYNKSFGYYTYDSLQTVSNKTLYDIASITKIAASTVSLMKLQDDGKFKLNSTLSDYLSDMVDSTKYKDLNLKEVLSHQSGLVAWIPFWMKTMQNKEPNPEYYSKDSSEKFSIRVDADLFIRNDYPQIIMQRILGTRFLEKEYRYSDLGYYFIKEIIKELSGHPINEFATKEFYEPLGMWHTTYLPLQKFSKEQITPTENDTYFRNEVVHGYVHDPGAAMIGGVGGHAGLFSNANDLGKLMYMLINEGEYAGKQYLSKEVIQQYTSCQFCETNRRAAGFDKPVAEGGGPTCDSISPNSFGHSGFTGTITWADPDEKVVYVFLSNRVYPSAENSKLVKMNIRTNIQKVIYDAIKQSKQLN